MTTYEPRLIMAVCAYGLAAMLFSFFFGSASERGDGHPAWYIGTVIMFAATAIALACALVEFCKRLTYS